MNNKGFTLIELIICLMIIGSLFMGVLSYIEKHHVGKRVAGVVKEAVNEFDSSKSETHSITMKTPESITKIKCVEGYKTIIIDGIEYQYGKVNSWGDIKGIKCN